MKKNSIIRSILVLCLIAVIAVTMSACGSKSEPEKASSAAKSSAEEVSVAEEEAATEAEEAVEETAEVTEEVEEQAEPEPASAESGKMTLEEYFNQHPEQLEAINKQVAESDQAKSWIDLLDFEVFANGNTLVYGYKYKQTYSQDQVNAIKGNIESSLDSLNDQMMNTIDVVESEFGLENIEIEIVYFNGDGSLIGNKVFHK